MDKISWTDIVKNEILQRIKEKRYIVLTIKRRKANWIGHILRRSCLLPYRRKDKRERRRGRRSKQLQKDHKGKGGSETSKRKHYIAHVGELALA
jgi:hypothetical protein